MGRCGVGAKSRPKSHAKSHVKPCAKGRARWHSFCDSERAASKFLILRNKKGARNGVLTPFCDAVAKS